MFCQLRDLLVFSLCFDVLLDMRLYFQQSSTQSGLQGTLTPESGSSLSAVRRRLQKIRSTLFWTTFVKYTDDIWPTDTSLTHIFQIRLKIDMHTRPTFYDKMYQLLTKEIIIRNRVIFITSKSDPKSAYKVNESKQRPQNEFYLSPPSECVEHHLLVEISTKDICLSESQFFFCLFFWSLRHGMPCRGTIDLTPGPGRYRSEHCSQAHLKILQLHADKIMSS